MEVIVFAAFMLLWKGLDTAVSMYQLYLSGKVEMAKGKEEVPAGNEEKHIGFVDYGNHLREIEEEEEE